MVRKGIQSWAYATYIGRAWGLELVRRVVAWDMFEGDDLGRRYIDGL